jgi:peptidyl-prolyl cis-trans isomerase-like 2
LAGKHTVFGKLVGGEDVLATIEKTPVHPQSEKPLKSIKITEVVMSVFHLILISRNAELTEHRYQDPFEDYKKRLARKLERQAQGGEQKTGVKPREGSQDHSMNWFGEKVGADKAAAAAKAGEVGVGVGKYLKRVAPAKPVGGDTGGEEKRRKLGFGNFDNW